ncbi:AprI/Inh family metalloprotease inhibitor [Roseiarcaceae bacterium H3SJ34-1]|uniref:AprI/Inh family metalloprotease inhibitor n=1 Tax=Terripilifer ovatus TaxID=3032367 RepID=UPI003AB98490|nr:AprI/Inh family metalloprotease inhibitor [Roseiarcaceae bacterium H3SJ34-1]
MLRTGKVHTLFASRAGRAAVMIGFICLSAAAGAATDINVVAGTSGAWDMSLNDTNRKCRLYLRVDTEAAGHALGMPSGCRRALPILMDVTAWNMPDESRIELADKDGKAILSFAPANENALAAKGPEGETYEMVNLNPAYRTKVAQAQTSTQTLAQAQPRTPAATAATRPAAQPQQPALPPARMSDIPGRYAVLRENGRDTGCMVTLMEQSRGRGQNRAQLAPACRDQGIVIFDPLGWSLERGQVVLTARKGHKLHLDHQPDGSWMKMDTKPIGLKRI